METSQLTTIWVIKWTKPEIEVENVSVNVQLHNLLQCLFAGTRNTCPNKILMCSRAALTAILQHYGTTTRRRKAVKKFVKKSWVKSRWFIGKTFKKIAKYQISFSKCWIFLNSWRNLQENKLKLVKVTLHIEIAPTALKLLAFQSRVCSTVKEIFTVVALEEEEEYPQWYQNTRTFHPRLKSEFNEFLLEKFTYNEQLPLLSELLFSPKKTNRKFLWYRLMFQPFSSVKLQTRIPKISKKLFDEQMLIFRLWSSVFRD